MAKAGLLFIGTDDGIILLSNPGTAGRWLRVGHELRGRAVHGIWVRHDDPRLVVAATSGGATIVVRHGAPSRQAIHEYL
ncbi:MAG TPA: hypothetical protein PKA05_11760 [Roseiflexaceae bacterium]|nr:hypothetical protein [Roseiflexaceae bacterium]